MGNNFAKEQVDALQGCEEILQLREFSETEYKKAFDIVDKDNSGSISRSEIKQLLDEVTQTKVNQSMVKVFLELFDKDHDDKVTWDEFKATLNVLANTIHKESKIVYEGDLLPVGAPPDQKDRFILRSGPKYQLQLVSNESNIEDNICLSPSSKVNSKNDIVRIKALQRQRNGDSLAVFMNAKASDSETASEWAEHIQQVIDEFKSAIENKTLNKGAIVKEGWLTKYPPTGMAKRRYFVIARTVNQQKVDSFLSFFYFVNQEKTTLKGMYPINQYCSAKVKAEDESKSKIIWMSQHINPGGKLTDQISVELEAQNRQQATDWIELLNYLAEISAKQPKDSAADRKTAELAVLASLDAVKDEAAASAADADTRALAVAEQIKSLELVPDIMPTLPDLSPFRHSDLVVKFSDVEIGQTHCPKLKAGQTHAAPKVLLKGSRVDTLYCLIKTDPDAPTRHNAAYREFIHHVIVNIKSRSHENELELTDEENGQTILPYVGCGAPCNSGFHRYVWLVFKQTRVVGVEDAKTYLQGRGGKRALDFAKTNGMEGPIAIACYEGEWDESVDALHEELGFMPPPEFQSPKQKAATTDSNTSEAAPVAVASTTVAVLAETDAKVATPESDNTVKHSFDLGYKKGLGFEGSSTANVDNEVVDAFDAGLNVARGYAPSNQKNDSLPPPPPFESEDSTPSAEPAEPEASTEPEVSEKKMTVLAMLSKLEEDLGIADAPKPLLKRVQNLEDNFFGEKKTGVVKDRVQAIWDAMY